MKRSRYQKLKEYYEASEAMWATNSQTPVKTVKAAQRRFDRAIAALAERNANG